jgi:hypothetical protein
MSRITNPEILGKNKSFSRYNPACEGWFRWDRVHQTIIVKRYAE